MLIFSPFQRPKASNRCNFFSRRYCFYFSHTAIKTVRESRAKRCSLPPHMMAAVILLSAAVFRCHRAPHLHPAAAALSRYASLCLCCGMFGSHGQVSPSLSPSRWSKADLMAPVFRCLGHSVQSRFERMKSCVCLGFFCFLLLLELEM